jgi:hypothetical protein
MRHKQKQNINRPPTDSYDIRVNGIKLSEVADDMESMVR